MFNRHRDLLERLKDVKIHMCLSSVSGYAPYKPIPAYRKSTFRYNSMFNFIPVSFSFLVIFRVRVRVRVPVRDWYIFDRWHCRHSGQSRPPDSCATHDSWYRSDVVVLSLWMIMRSNECHSTDVHYTAQLVT